MSDMNPINSQALVLFEQTASRVLSTSTQDALSALSSVDNSAQQLMSAPRMDRSLSPPPEIACHLQQVSDIADAERHVAHSTAPSPAAQQWRDDRPVSSNWIAGDALPFFATEEMGDEKPDAGFSFMQKAMRQMPHVAEKIYVDTCERLKKDLQAYLCGDGRITPETAEQAWRHFQVELSGSKCRALEHIIRTSKTLTATEQKNLLRRLHDAQAHHVARSTIADGKIKLSDMPAGSLSPDTIEILARFGATTAELQQFRGDAAAAQFIGEKLENQTWPETRNDLSQLVCSNPPSKEIETLITVIGELNEAIRKAEDFILYDLSFSGIDAETGDQVNVAENIYEKFLCDFLNAYPRYRLHQAVSQHNAYLLPSSLLHPKKRDLLSYRDNLPKLNAVLNPDYAQRSRLLRHIDIAPVIFADSGEKTLPARAAPPYGDRCLPVRFFDNLINNPEISLERLKYIFCYCNLRLIEITNSGDIDLSWFARFPDETLRLIFYDRKDDSSYFDTGKNYRHPELKLLGAVKEIGKVINPDYDDPKLPELLAWIKERLAYQGSENDLACALFTNAPGYSIALCNIAVRIKAARRTGSHVSYYKADVIRDFSHFCRKVMERETG